MKLKQKKYAIKEGREMGKRFFSDSGNLFLVSIIRGIEASKERLILFLICGFVITVGLISEKPGYAQNIIDRALDKFAGKSVVTINQFMFGEKGDQNTIELQKNAIKMLIDPRLSKGQHYVDQMKATIEKDLEGDRGETHDKRPQSGIMKSPKIKNAILGWHYDRNNRSEIYSLYMESGEIKLRRITDNSFYDRQDSGIGFLFGTPYFIFQRTSDVQRSFMKANMLTGEIEHLRFRDIGGRSNSFYSGGKNKGELFWFKRRRINSEGWTFLSQRDPLRYKPEDSSGKGHLPALANLLTGEIQNLKIGEKLSRLKERFGVRHK